MASEPRPDEQLVSRAVEAGLSSQLDAAENVSVDVRTDLLHAVQGQVDSVAVSGQGVVMQGLTVQDMEVQTDRIQVNPLSILFGKVEFNQPVNAAARMTLTESDLDRALNSDLVLNQIPPLHLSVDGEKVIVSLQPPLKVRLPGNNRIGLDGNARLQEPTGTRQLGFSVVIIPRTDDRPALLESFNCQPGTGMSIAFTIALMQKLQEILDLPYLQIDGMAFRIKNLDVHAGSVAIQTEARVHRIPDLQS
ncbi:DUF2993 domain-containing protein [Leptolyngbya sp. FACHB-36]|uniref:LmeA family phospholipid-binding protein n=1 Tax=Leptolyngbya sp. FACHB-36 TaxID=2692808 RepID=UPI0016806C45|nr:DUF2993 domain-containing protein [Leptolyngbya sp. FACHB-36]MBD2021814.1 DUF2993 domain-containing protein [Leptolyngbya sp. FACHB-36]